MQRIGATDIAGTARAGRSIVNRFVHRSAHVGVMAHAKIIVRAPGDNLGHAIGAGPLHFGVLTRRTLKLCENSITAFALQRIDALGEEGGVII